MNVVQEVAFLHTDIFQEMSKQRANGFIASRTIL